MGKILDNTGSNNFELPCVVFPDEDSTSGDILGYWRWTPSPPSPKGELVWHYPDSQGTLGILSSKRVWATSMASLNDAEEFAHGMAILRECMDYAEGSKFIHVAQKRFMKSVVENVENLYPLSNLYVFCASEEPDISNQWRNYGSDGIGIK